MNTKLIILVVLALGAAAIVLMMVLATFPVWCWMYNRLFREMDEAPQLEDFNDD